MTYRVEVEHTTLPYSKWGRTNDVYSRGGVLDSKHAKDFLTIPKTMFVFLSPLMSVCGISTHHQSILLSPFLLEPDLIYDRSFHICDVDYFFQYADSYIYLLLKGNCHLADHSVNLFKSSCNLMMSSVAHTLLKILASSANS